MKIQKIILGMSMLLAVYSCSSYKHIAYLQDMDTEQEYQVPRNPDAKILTSDALCISVSSSVPELAAPFNISGHIGSDVMSGLDLETGSNPEPNAYKVDEDGNIIFPVLGKIHVAGLTLEEVKGKIEGMLEGKYVSEPSVTVTFSSFKVLALGAIGKPGTYSIPTGSVDIFQFLAMIGDLSTTADRAEVWVIREENGKKKLHKINLQSVDCYKSPVYYLKQDDMVYVRPDRNELDPRLSKASNIVNLISTPLSLIMTTALLFIVYTR